jgi:hypothetical protein
VPLNENAQVATVDVVPLPVAVHVMVSPDNVPVAVPVTVRLPAHVAVNVPVAPVADAEVIVHLKFEQVLVSTVSDETELHAPVRDPSVGVVLGDVVEERTPQAVPLRAAKTAAARIRRVIREVSAQAGKNCKPSSGPAADCGRLI